MSTPYPSQMTGAQIENALNKVNGLTAAANNGKILCIDNGSIAAKSAIEIQGGTIDAITITENGVYTHSENGGYSPISVSVPTGAITETLIVTNNGTYAPSIGVDGFSQVSVNVESGSDIPSTYQKVEYIKGTGTQWIDTGVAQNACMGIECKIKVYDKTLLNGCGIAGTNINNGYASYAHYYLPSGDRFYVPQNVLGNSDTYVDIAIVDNAIYNICFFISLINSYNNSYNGCIKVNQKIKSWTKSGISMPTENVSVFALNEGSGVTPTVIGAFQLYSFKMYGTTSGEIIRDFIPCYRKSDNVIGLYDKINGAFYDNDGTGIFEKGQDV